MKRYRLLLTALCLLLPNLVSAETWAEKLGFASDKRVVILHANYMGAAYEFNRPGQELLEKGHVQSASLMVPCPWFEEFADWCRQHPQHDVGVCLTLNSPGTHYRWQPLSGPQSSSLVDADGYQWQTELQFAIRADTNHVAKEIDLQIDKARRAGVRPTHLVPFMGSLLTRPDLARLYLETAERNWIPAVMVELTPKNIESLRNDGFPVTDELVAAVARYPLPKLDDLHFIPESDSYDATRDAFYDLIRRLSPGLTQIVSGPADETAAFQRISPRWQHRVWEKKLLADPKVHQFLADEGIVLTDWKEIMLRFESGAAPNRSRRPNPEQSQGDEGAEQES